MTEDRLRRMNHDQWPPVDPPEIEDVPAWAVLSVMVILAVPLLIVAGVSLLHERLIRPWR